VFTRAFRRQFGLTPSAYRRNALTTASPAAKARHVTLTDATAPCVGLYYMHVEPPPRRLAMPMLSIERRQLTPAHVLIVRARCARHELAKTMGESFGKAFPYAMGTGVPLAGRPFTRYVSSGPGLFTIESGCVLASPAAGSGEVESATLPGGAAAVALHGGSYDSLSETYAEMERWMEKNGMQPGEGPWESYITDPAEHPDPAEWRTEIYWPLRPR
jgi:effector-binding domain-containing protein